MTLIREVGRFLFRWRSAILEITLLASISTRMTSLDMIHITHVMCHWLLVELNKLSEHLLLSDNQMALCHNLIISSLSERRARPPPTTSTTSCSSIARSGTQGSWSGSVGREMVMKRRPGTVYTALYITTRLSYVELGYSAGNTVLTTPTPTDLPEIFSSLTWRVSWNRNIQTSSQQMFLSQSFTFWKYSSDPGN